MRMNLLPVAGVVLVLILIWTSFILKGGSFSITGNLIKNTNKSYKTDSTIQNHDIWHNVANISVENGEIATIETKKDV